MRLAIAQVSNSKFPTRKNLTFVLGWNVAKLKVFFARGAKPHFLTRSRDTRRVSARPKEAHTSFLETSTRRKAKKLLLSRDGPISPVRFTRGLRLYQVSKKLEILCEVVFRDSARNSRHVAVLIRFLKCFSSVQFS